MEGIKQSTALIHDKEEKSTLLETLTQKDKIILGSLFALGAAFLICLSTVAQAALELTYLEGLDFGDQHDEFGVSGLLEWCADGKAGLIYFLVLLVVAIIPPTVFIMFALIILYPMKKSTREWIEFIAIHNARGMFSYTFSFYIAYDGITVDCDVFGTVVHIQGLAETGIIFVFLYTVVMCALGTYIHFLYYEHDTSVEKDKYSPFFALASALFLIVGMSVPFGKSDFRGFLSEYCNDGEEFVWFDFIGHYTSNEWYTGWWQFFTGFSYLLFFVIIPIVNVILLIATAASPGNYNLYVPQFIFTQFYPMDYCILKFFLVSFEYHNLIKAMIDDVYAETCDFIGGLVQPSTDTCFTEHWLLRGGLIVLFLHVVFYWTTEYLIYQNKVSYRSDKVATFVYTKSDEEESRNL